MEAKLNWLSPMMLRYCSKVIVPWSGRSDYSDVASGAICLPKNFTEALSSIFPGMTVTPRRNSFGNNGRAIYWGGGGGVSGGQGVL